MPVATAKLEAKREPRARAKEKIPEACEKTGTNQCKGAMEIQGIVVASKARGN